MVNAFDPDKRGFQLTVCPETGCYAEQLESWFDARQVASFPVVLKLYQCTCVPEASNLRLLCSSVLECALFGLFWSTPLRA